MAPHRKVSEAAKPGAASASDNVCVGTSAASKSWRWSWSWSWSWFWFLRYGAKGAATLCPFAALVRRSHWQWFIAFRSWALWQRSR